MGALGKHQLTAIIRNKRGQILSVGRNSYVKTHPIMQKAAFATGSKERLFLHAEAAALLRCKDWSKAFSIEIFRFTKDGLPALAKPCPCCQYLISQTAIKKVIHT